MDIDVSLERINRLDLSGFNDRETVQYCPKCDWQMSTCGYGPNHCPECRHHGLALGMVRQKDDVKVLCIHKMWSDRACNFGPAHCLICKQGGLKP